MAGALSLAVAVAASSRQGFLPVLLQERSLAKQPLHLPGVRLQPRNVVLDVSAVRDDRLKQPFGCQTGS